MALLAAVQYFCGRTNIPVPASVVGTTDSQVLQTMRLLEEEGNDLALRGMWEALTREATLTTVATASQGAMTTLASNGFRFIKNGTIWDRTNKLPVVGPMDDQQWQAIQALTWTGPRYHYRIRGGLLLSTPTPTAGYTWAFEYLSKNWILGADGTTYKQYFTLDTDTMLLPEELLLAGLRWRWKKEKGLDYAEDFRTYEIQVKDALGRDGGKPRLNMGDPGWNGPVPGIFVSPGSWSIP